MTSVKQIKLPDGQIRFATNAQVMQMIEQGKDFEVMGEKDL